MGNNLKNDLNEFLAWSGSAGIKSSDIMKVSKTLGTIFIKMAASEIGKKNKYGEDGFDVKGLLAISFALHVLKKRIDDELLNAIIRFYTDKDAGEASNKEKAKRDAEEFLKKFREK